MDDDDDDFKELRGGRRRRRQEEAERGGGMALATAPASAQTPPSAAARRPRHVKRWGLRGGGFEAGPGRAWGGGRLLRSPGPGAAAGPGPGTGTALPSSLRWNSCRSLAEVERLPRPSAGHSAQGPGGGKGVGSLEGPGGGRGKGRPAGLGLPPPRRLQAALGSGLPSSLCGPKRKVFSSTEQSTKRRKTGARMGAAEEELLVAMAMSRSLHEEEEAKARLLTCGRPSRAWQGRKNPRAVKKNHVMAPHSPPTLLLQDPEKGRRQMEERVALLLSEVEEFPSTPPLPPSRLLALELSRRVGWPLVLPKGPPSTLWQCSSLVGPVCVAGSTLPAEPWQTAQRPLQSTALPFLGSIIAEAEEMLLQESNCQDKSAQEEREDAVGCSQKEAGALQNLMQLAGEGLVLTPGSPAAQAVEEPGQEWAPGDAPQNNPDPFLEKKSLLGSCSPSFLLGPLAAAFKGMVNNPHLSDIQLQVDSGELFYAHMFVLYARCPQLMEMVDQKGFLVAEGGGGKTRRLVLNDVSGGAVGAFLNYLYAAELLVPQHVLSEVAALAMRFGVAELAALCAGHSGGGRLVAGVCGWEEEDRVEKFEELLKSIWVGEGEEDKALLPEDLSSENVVDEQQLEEIYEFAATQRKTKEGRCRRERNVVGIAACPRVEPEEMAVPGDSSEWKGSLEPEPSHLRAQDAREETVPSLLLYPQQDAEEWGPLGAASRRHPEALLELAEVSQELSEKSPLSVSCGGSLELFQQSCNSWEPSDGAAGEGVGVDQSSTPLGVDKGILPVSRNFSSGDSQVSLVVPASEQRRDFCSDLELTVFSPAPQEASGRPCRVKGQELPRREREASSGVAAGRGAPLPSSSSSSTGDLMLRLDAEGKRQVEVMRFPFKEREASEAMEVDFPCCQGMGGALVGRLPVGEAEASEEKMLLPGAALPSGRGPKRGQVATPGLASRLPTETPAAIPSPGPRCPSPCSSACLPGDGKATADVVIVEDSEEEAEAAPQLTWGSSVLEADLLVLEEDGGPEGLVAAKATGCQLGSSPRPLLMRSGTPPGGSGPAGNGPWPHCGYAEEERGSSDGSGRRRQGFRDQGDESEVLPLRQRLSAPLPVHKTPDPACQEREAPHTTPPTPVPSYSIMETPELRKELSRFGVRTLPKQQMVVKLKEIFQYTHQRPDAKDETTSSQLVLCPKAAPRRPTSVAAPSGSPKLLAGGRFRGCSGAGDQGHVAKWGCLAAGSGRLKSAVEGPVRGGRAPAPCRKAEDGLSAAACEMSVILHSSSTEFETGVLAEEEEEDIPAFQSTCHEADTLVALRQYIHSRPSLCRQILLYQPFELARLQSELKQNGIRIALGRLLEFLDAHCITFTTAETGREKQQQSGRQGKRKRY